MKLRKLLAAASFVAATVVPAVSMASPVHAAAVTPLQCQYPIQVFDIEQESTPEVGTESCDLAIDKQVSINSGAYVEADTSTDAAMANVGDTVTYKVTVTNNSTDGYVPTGQVTVHDLLPSGVSFGSAVATVGSYSETTGDWVFPLTTEGTNLPATLTITTTVNVTGLVQNTAAFSTYKECSGDCVAPETTYVDADSSNNSNDAWVDPQVKPQVLGASTTSTPQVLGASTLANTGSNTLMPSAVAALLTVATLALGYLTRRQKHQLKS